MSRVETTVLLCLLAAVWAAVAARPLVARYLTAPPVWLHVAARALTVERLKS